MDDARRIRVSRFLSLVLRHRPDKIGLKLDAAGWAGVEELLRQLAIHGHALDRDNLEQVVARCDKQRFVFDREGTHIRAVQGHSRDIELGYTPTEPPDELYHGTAERFVAAIRREGLRKMQRHHVHLSPDRDTATRVGARRGPAVILRVDAAAMRRDGHTFFVADNGVWLTDAVPPQYLAFPCET
ncbi:MAG: RNA 2'-phosphotransferase [Planctomycetes bacterium]|nr:RNA 2'-phosphotransferase [Planctomycetota bacterium]